MTLYFLHNVTYITYKATLFLKEFWSHLVGEINVPSGKKKFSISLHFPPEDVTSTVLERGHG